MSGMKIGDPCPGCAAPLVRRQGSFYWRGHLADGAYCEHCNALWEIIGEEIIPLRPVEAQNDRTG